MTLWRRLVQWIRRLVRPDSVYYIGGSDTLPPPLTGRRKRRYWSACRVKQRGKR